MIMRDDAGQSGMQGTKRMGAPSENFSMVWCHNEIDESRCPLQAGILQLAESLNPGAAVRYP